MGFFCLPMVLDQGGAFKNILQALKSKRYGGDVWGGGCMGGGGGGGGEGGV